VLHLDRIERKRLPRKCSGVFASKCIAQDPLLDGLRWPLRIFHSRLNDLTESDLAARGYHVLTRADGAGVDIFMKRYGSLFVFFQGHPEYDPHSLRGEYLRDVGRYLNGKQDNYPTMPSDYFDDATTSYLEAIRLRAMTARERGLAAECREVLDRASVSFDRRGAATTIFRNWLGYLVEAKTARVSANQLSAC
jgi:homoserine O-succinyltransferase/O-acetyltransferase